MDLAKLSSRHAHTYIWTRPDGFAIIDSLSSLDAWLWINDGVLSSLSSSHEVWAQATF